MKKRYPLLYGRTNFTDNGLITPGIRPKGSVIDRLDTSD
jgi:hypothetical protein